MPRIFMYMFSMKSAGGLDVKKALSALMADGGDGSRHGCQQIKHEGSSFRGDRDTVVINWGCGSSLPRAVRSCHVINSSEAVYNAIDKPTFLRLCTISGVRTVPWTDRTWEAQLWLDRGDTVFCRTQLHGRQGQGIVVVEPGGEIIRANLYTKYIEALREYRMHVCDGEVIAVHRKVQTGEPEDVANENYIKNTRNGWVFRRVSRYPRDCATQAIAAIKAVGLDFGVVDVLWQSDQPERCQLQEGAGGAYVLEANTAPGIDTMTWTCEQYAAALKQLAEKKVLTA